MKSLLLLAILTTGLLPHGLLSAEELELRPLEPIVKDLLAKESPDMSELAYVASRGAALFLTLGTYIENNAVEERGDKKTASRLNEKADAYYKVAVAMGLATKKTEDITKKQMLTLLGAYAKMLVASKNLNNEIASPAMRRDMAALKDIEPLILELAADIAKDADKPGAK